MDSNIVAALIGVFGVIMGALLRTFSTDLIDVLRSMNMRVPDIRGQWNAAWYVANESEEELYIEDIVVVEKVRGSKVRASGRDHKGSYLFTGKLSVPGILTLSYESVDAGYSLTGVVILKIGPLGKTCEGHWYGYTEDGRINGGKVVWTRTDSLHQSAQRDYARS